MMFVHLLSSMMVCLYMPLLQYDSTCAHMYVMFSVQRKVSYFTSRGHTIPYLLKVKFVTCLLSVTQLIVKQ